MSAFLDALADLCRAHPLREKIVVVPSLAIGHQIGDAIARGGTRWVNLHFETTRTIADAVASLDLAREGKTVLSRAQALALIERACDRVLDDSSYFAALRSRPGLHRAIQRSIDDLRLAGVGVLDDDAFETRRKAADLTRILTAYEEELRERALVDRFGVVARAIERLESGAPTPWGDDAIWIACDEMELAHEEARLVTLASRGAATVRLLSTPDADASMPALANVHFVRVEGEENEVRAVFRAILGEGGRFDDAELIYTTSEPYLPLAYELCAEHGIDATFAEGIAVSFTSPGQACLAFLRWCGSGWEAADLARAARAGVLRTTSNEGGDVPPAAFARVIRGAAIGWGRERYVPQLEAFVAAHQKAADDEERPDSQRAARRRDADHGRGVLRRVQELLDITHDLDSERVRTNVLARAAGRFAREMTRTRSELDAMAVAALTRMFDELASLPDAAVDIAEGCARLRDAVLALHTSASNPRPGRLHVVPIRAAAWSGRRRLFLVGLDQSKFPGAGLQDPIVLDAERESLNRNLTQRQLALQGEAPLRAAERLRRCLSRGRDARWTIGFSSHSLREQRESFPANDLLDVFRAASGNPSATFEDLIAGSEIAGFIEPSAPAGPAEWWLAQRFDQARTDYVEVLSREYRWLSRGDAAERARASSELTRWDGVVPLDSAEIDPRRNGRLLSASQIERMASCPYGWFLRHVLKIEPLEELVRDLERWLDPRHRGLVLHEIFERTLQTLCERGERPVLDAHLPLMTEIARESLARWRTVVPPPNDTAFERQRDEVLATCATFLRVEEIACRNAEPTFFELPFGLADAASHAAGMVEPLSIDLGGGRAVKLRGRIDRVDRLADGSWAVWDYKTGGLFGWDGVWTFARGSKVQHAIYARAAAAILRARGIDEEPVIAESGYSFPTPKGGGERYAKSAGPGDLEHVLNLTFDVIASGLFPHPEDVGDCRFCDFTAVCGGAEQAAARSKEKLAANEENPMVKKWRRLGEVG